MLQKEKAIFNWSGGKDSALCLHKVLLEQKIEIVCLLTTISEPYQRVSMHGVRSALLEMQAERTGLPLVKLPIPEMPSMETYDKTMAEALAGLQDKGVTISVFGDIFLEDLRKYREDKLAEVNLRGLFPLWGIPTRQLIREFIGSGFKAVITCVNEQYLDKSFAGRIIDDDFIKDLPANVDPCGENGEYHSFVYDAPFFSSPVPFEKGEIVYRKYQPARKQENRGDDGDIAGDRRDESPYDHGFWYCDLLPGCA
ncbi:MAG: ATP-binding protein [Bacteroidota bacterium]